MNPLIKIEHVKKSFGQELLFSDLTFQIMAGEILVIVGASGAGKTTLLNIMAGLDGDYEGIITYDAQLFDGIEVARPIVFQEFDQLLPWYNVEKNILLPYPRKVFTPTDLEIIEFVGLKEHLHKRPRALSGGMKQRTAIARSLLSDSKIIFMDEPFGSLDTERRQQLQKLIKDINRTYKRTIVFITHDMEEARSLGHRILRLEGDGTITITENQ